MCSIFIFQPLTINVKRGNCCVKNRDRHNEEQTVKKDKKRNNIKNIKAQLCHVTKCKCKSWKGEYTRQHETTAAGLFCIFFLFTFCYFYWLQITVNWRYECTRNKLFALFLFLSPTFVSECRCHYKINFVIQGRDFCFWWGYVNRSRSVSLRITKRICSWSICSFGESPSGTICQLCSGKKMCSFCIMGQSCLPAYEDGHVHGSQGQGRWWGAP